MRWPLLLSLAAVCLALALVLGRSVLIRAPVGRAPEGASGWGDSFTVTRGSRDPLGGDGSAYEVLDGGNLILYIHANSRRDTAFELELVAVTPLMFSEPGQRPRVGVGIASGRIIWKGPTD